MEKHIIDILGELGIPAHLNGYKYIKTAVTQLLSVKSKRFYATALYCDVAKIYDTTATRVERSIRHAIETGVDRGNVDIWTKLFRYSFSSERGKPTNSEFLATLVEHLRVYYGADREA